MHADERKADTEDAILESHAFARERWDCHMLDIGARIAWDACISFKLPLMG